MALERPFYFEQPCTDFLRDLRHNGVAERSEFRGSVVGFLDRSRRFPFVLRLSWSGGPSVHPSGNPMSCETQAGLSDPLLSYGFRLSPFPAVDACSMSPMVTIELVGVAQFAWVRRIGAPCLFGDWPIPPVPSLLVGVAQTLRTTASVNVVPECRPLSVEYPADPLAL